MVDFKTPFFTDWRLRKRNALIAFAAMSFFLFATSNFVYGDFSIFRQACHLLMNHLNPYNPIGYPEFPMGGFIYPPMAWLIAWIPSLLPFAFGLWIWTFLSYAWFSASIFLWYELIKGKRPSFRNFCFAFVTACTAQTIWSFWFHQMSIAALFFATLSCWLQFKGKNDFLSGLSSGFMMVKPHLCLPVFLYLIFRSSRRLNFLGGFLVIAGLSLFPYLTAMRPWSDFQNLKESIHNHATYLYSRDDQNIAGKAYEKFFMPSSQKADLSRLKTLSSDDCYMIKSSAVMAVNHIKEISYILFLVCFGIFLHKNHLADPTKTGTWVLALSLLFSSYSHLYDGVFLIPLLLTAILRSRYDLSFFAMLAIPSVIISFEGLFNWHTHALSWDFSGYMTTMYFLIILGIIFLKKSGPGSSYQRFPIVNLSTGQATTEFVIMLILFTGIGYWIMKDMGISQDKGAIGAAQTSTINSIVADDK